jgi:uncharacterized YigZ family protein
VKNPPLDSHFDDPPDSYLTLSAPSSAERKVQRSRFVGLAVPVGTAQEAQDQLAETARQYHDARHVCYGYRLGVGSDLASRKSDDGEPSGTAGEPILTAITQLELTDVLVMVVRYFGGIKLGTGGLARAYGQTAADALSGAVIRKVPLGRMFALEFTYAQEKTVRRLLETWQGKPIAQDYGAQVNWRIWLPHSAWRGFAAALTDHTAAGVSMQEVDT